MIIALVILIVYLLVAVGWRAVERESFTIALLWPITIVMFLALFILDVAERVFRAVKRTWRNL